ncbi:sigma-54-dependent transcriptional regulator [Calditrichota bacterium GD2]
MFKILLIDDNEAYCEQIKKSLELKNYYIEYETNAYRGLEYALQSEWDVVLVDMVLGQQIDGLAILKEIKKKRADIPVILISGSSVIEAAHEWLEAGAYDYLEKPIDLERLIITLNHALELRKISRLNQSLVDQLKRNISTVGLGNTLSEALRILSEASDTPERLLILGEKGTGKELIAKLLHYSGQRKYSPFVAHDCELQTESDEAALNALYKNLFEQARGGTLFLREIHNLNLAAQKYLVNFLHQNFFNSNPALPMVKNDVRFIASSSIDLKALVEQDAFLSELFHLLANFTIKIPPLRQRVGDIPLLVRHFIDLESRSLGIKIEKVSEQAIQLLQRQDWPGNITQLKNVTHYMALLQKNGIIAEQETRLALKLDSIIRDLHSGENIPDNYKRIDELLGARELPE